MNAAPPTDAGSPPERAQAGGPPGGGVNRVAVIGLGAMGLAMAGRLVAEGLAVRGFDPSAERCQPSSSGLTKARVMAHMWPETPASAPASTKAASLMRKVS